MMQHRNQQINGGSPTSRAVSSHARRIALFYIASNHRQFHKRIVLTCSHVDCVRAWAEVSLQCRWVCPWTTTQSATWQEGGSTPPPTQHPGPRHISLISCSYQLQQQELVEEELMEITEGRTEDNVDHSTELRDLEHVWSMSLLPLGGEEDIWNKNQSQWNVQTVHSSVCRKLFQ